MDAADPQIVTVSISVNTSACWRRGGGKLVALETDPVMDHSSRDTALRPNPDVIAKRLDEVMVLVHIPTNRIFELNETGTRVWAMIGEGLDPDRIVRCLVDEFDVEEARAADEVKELLERLSNEGLIAS